MTPSCGFGPAFAWVALWTQFATLRFFDKNEGLFKDLIVSGAIDLAVSSIEAKKLIPALATLCDAVLETKRIKEQSTPAKISTTDVLTEVDFLPHLATAEAALREKEGIDQLLHSLQRFAANLWRIALAHSFAIILIPASFLLTTISLRITLGSIFILTAVSSFCWLIYGSIRYQKMRDQLLKILSSNRSAE